MRQIICIIEVPALHGDCIIHRLYGNTTYPNGTFIPHTELSMLNVCRNKISNNYTLYCGAIGSTESDVINVMHVGLHLQL